MSNKPMEMHGGNRTRLYYVWHAMRDRCNKPNIPAYKDYGGRGITVCQEWQVSFAAFRDWAMSHGYAEGLTIDRIDNDGNYCPQNCRWITQKMQCNNQRARRCPSKSSSYTGVVRRSHGWQCQVAGRPNSGKRHCGYFSSEIEAAITYDRIVSEEIPSRTVRNFPALAGLYEKGDSNGR